jgi:hypothetical protein
MICLFLVPRLQVDVASLVIQIRVGDKQMEVRLSSWSFFLR